MSNKEIQKTSKFLEEINFSNAWGKIDRKWSNDCKEKWNAQKIWICKQNLFLKPEGIRDVVIDK